VILQAPLPDRPGFFAAVMPNPFAGAPYNERPWCVRVFERDAVNPDHEEFDDGESARKWAEGTYGIKPDAWMKAERPGSALTLARILTTIWTGEIPEDELNAVIRLTYSQLPLDEHGLTIWPSEDSGVITIRAICYGLFEEIDALRGPGFTPLAPLGYDYVMMYTGDERLDGTDVLERMKGEITREGRISRWLPLDT